MNQNPRFVDTGYWLAIANSDDAYHERAASLAADQHFVQARFRALLRGM